MMRPSLRIIEGLVQAVSSKNPNKEDRDRTFRYIDLSSVDHDRKIITLVKELKYSEAPSRARQLVRNGDVLVSTVRPNLNGVAKVPMNLDMATASTGFCVLRPKRDELDNSYLFHWVKTPAFIAEMEKLATGAMLLTP